ncbi:HD domain-containing protein [Emticicia fluvialis]|uniref:HD domain-containing protein n=1 Tax=Emticicia fluvialis TaxID=2974474 RepID=UPI0021665CAA|nr:HD domain-containing protein [Emticicia fluvialis]
MTKIKNLETEFLSLRGRQDIFPAGKNYVNIYEELKGKFDTQVHPEIKTKILEIEKEGYFNDHGVDHIKMVIERATWILNELNVSLENKEGYFSITPYEIFLLLVAIQLHDTGHLIGSRKEHAHKGKELLAKFDSGNSLSTAERKHIGDIAKAHGGKEDPIGKLHREENLSHQKIRPQLLAAILRLADELAEDKTRASKFLLDTGNMTATSEIFHRYSGVLDSIFISGGEVKMDFYVHDELLRNTYPMIKDSQTIQQFLIDEIYVRTFKTFTESLYCSRFLPYSGRINTVKANIHILSSIDDDEIKCISYELKETGYPFISDKDIYDLCESLKENNKRIDGEFIKNFIEQRAVHEPI